jgi:outer membrane protein assembly factor BamA
VEFKGVDKYTPVEYYFNNWSDLKRSTGVSLQWLSPLGFFRLSFGIPLNARRGDVVNYGDSTERVQFSVGQAFNQTF